MNKKQLKQLIKETIQEVSSNNFVNVNKSNSLLIYFIDDRELYLLNPHKLICQNCNIENVGGWIKANVISGEDLRDFTGVKIDIDDSQDWYIVPKGSNIPLDHVFPVLLMEK